MTYPILIVDDENEICTMLAGHLMLEGYKVFTANTVEEAWQQIKKHNIMVVISDMIMPEKDGIDFLKELKSTDGLIQVIMITGHVTNDKIIDAFRYGANNVVFKPFADLSGLMYEIKRSQAKLAVVAKLLRGEDQPRDSASILN